MSPRTARPRVGFLGVGWIGRNRMEAIIEGAHVEVVGVCDGSDEATTAALGLAAGAQRVGSLDELLELGLDGVVIATPSALHAEQTIRALEHGAAVFCQKPLALSATEARRVVDAARAADRLLAVDLSYRFTKGARRIRELAAAGDLGHVHAIDLTFHNAYGPDKPWFYDPALSGGGCVIDLGVHLVDLALWILDFPEILEVTSYLSAGGERLRDRSRVEDYAVATLVLGNGAVVRIACSWRLEAGCDAVIAASLYGTEGGAELRNIGGSFYDFRAEHFRGTSRESLAEPPDAWGGRAAQDWAARLANGNRFSDEAARLVLVSEVLDRIYGRPD